MNTPLLDLSPQALTRVVDDGAPISWTHGVEVGHGAWAQLENTARLPFASTCTGKAATVGSVVATPHGVVPSSVGRAPTKTSTR